MAEAAAREFIARRAEAGAPDLDTAIEHNLPISFATTRLQSQVYNAQPGTVAFAEPDDAVGLICWLFGKELLAKISAGFREIGDDKHALDQRQREEMEAQISADMLMAERSECALIWHAETQNNEIIDFRARRAQRQFWASPSEPCRARLRRQRHRSMVTTSSSEGGGERDAHPLRLRANSAGDGCNGETA